MTPITEESARRLAIDARREELLTVKEYARLKNEHPRSVYRRIKAGRQRGVHRNGRDIRIDITAAARTDWWKQPGTRVERFKRRLAGCSDVN